jgi:hypothetical protein
VCHINTGGTLGKGITAADLAGSHGNIGAHIHFEALNLAGKVIENLHIPLL